MLENYTYANWSRDTDTGILFRQLQQTIGLKIGWIDGDT